MHAGAFLLKPYDLLLQTSFSPAQLFSGGYAGAWYEPSDLSTIFQDSAGTIPGVINAPVGKVLDKSGNGNHLTQATAVNRPTLKFVNGHYVLDFDANVPQWLQCPNNIFTNFTSVGYVLHSAKIAIDPPVSNVLSGGLIGNFGTDALADNYPFTDALIYTDVFSTARKNGIPEGGTLGIWHLREYRSQTGYWQSIYNGSEEYNDVTSIFGANNNNIFIGASNGPFYNGQCGNIIIINRLLTSSELLNARNYCANANSIILPHGLQDNGLANFIVDPQNFNTVNWTSGNGVITTDVAIAPDGTATADKFAPDTVNTTHVLYAVPVVPNGVTTISCFAKAAGNPRFGIRYFDGTQYTHRCTWDLTNGSVALLEAGVQNIIPCGNNWYFCSITGTTTGSGATNFESLAAGNVVQGIFPGDNVSGTYLWQAQHVVGSKSGPKHWVL